MTLDSYIAHCTQNNEITYNKKHVTESEIKSGRNRTPYICLIKNISRGKRRSWQRDFIRTVQIACMDAIET
jgi:ribosomal protein S8